jgi:tetratricopeptide (TPR) repeat protein
MKIPKTINNNICAEAKQNRINFLIMVLIFISFNASNVLAKSGIGTQTLSSKSMRSMARVYMSYGYYGKAQPLAERALELAEQSAASDEELSMCLGDLSYIYTKQGQLENAEEKCKLSIELQEKVYNFRHPYIAYSLRNLCTIYRLQGKVQEAEETLKTSLAIMYEYYKADDGTLAPFYVDLAKVFVSMNNVQQAEEYFSKALDMVVGRYGSDHLYTANVMSDVAEFYAANGNYEKAEPLARKAQAVQERVYGRNHHLVAPTWLTMAAIYRAKGQPAQAEKFIAKAVTTVERTGDIAAVAKLSQQSAEVRNVKAFAFAGAERTINN